MSGSPEGDGTVAGELRDMPCDHDPIALLALNNDAVVWCTVSRLLVAWSRQAEAPQELMRLPFAPVTMTLTDGGLLALTNGSAGVFAYTLRLTAEGDLTIDEHVVIRDIERGILSAQATDVTVAQDESAIAVATPSHLAVLSLGQGAHARAVPCRSWFGQPHDGCALVCFATPTRLLVCSDAAHLVSLRVDVDAMSVVRERDGHVLARGKASITCLAPSFAHDNLLLVGFSNGALQLLQLDSLTPTRTLEASQLLRRLTAPPGAVAVVPPSHPTFDAKRPWRTEPPPAAGDETQPFRDSAVLSVAVGASMLTILTTDGVLFVHKASLDLCADTSFLLEPEERLPVAAARCTAAARNGCWCASHPDSGVLHYFVADAATTALTKAERAAAWGRDDTPKGADGDVIHAHAPLPATWLTPAPPLADVGVAQTTGKRSTTKAGQNAGVDRPVTFGHRIQSSGYSQAVPWSEQQKQKKRTQARRAQLQKAQQFAAGGGGVITATTTAPTAQRYRDVEPYADHPLRGLARVNTLLETKTVLHEGSVLAAAFAGPGSSLLTAASDGSAHQLKYPVAGKEATGRALRGHKGAVLSIDANLSLKSPLTLTSSADGVVALWRPSAHDTPVVEYDPTTAAAAAGESKGGEVRAARFFYLDKLICFTHGRRCLISQYALETREEQNGLMRVVSPARITEPLFAYAIPDAQSIVAMECVNHFLSPLVVLAGSNKSLCILDVAAQAPLRLITDAHSRAIHHVAMCTSSRFAGGLCGSLAEHTLLTAGLDGTVNLWDLREPNKVRTFALHKNTALQTVGLALSPTGQQFAVGSEDRQVYVYDARAAMTALDVLAVRDVPSAISWHPTEPVLAVGDTSGRITFFAQK